MAIEVSADGYAEGLLVIAGAMLAGNELAIAAFVHPALNRISDTSHAEAASRIARVLGRAMPFWYGAILLLSLWVAWRSDWETQVIGAAAIYAVSILITVTLLVPINNKVAAMDPHNPPANWKELRTRWDRVHRVRVLMLIAAAVCSFQWVMR